ncbi:trehalose-phosphatase [Chloroflexota bacterium]
MEIRKTSDGLPSAIQKKDEILNRLDERTLAIFLDYDGTLTPIVEDPKKATLSDKARMVIKRLAKYYLVAIISGRDLEDVHKMVDIDDIAYAGSHGFDIIGPGGKYRDWHIGEPFLPVLKRAEKELRTVLKDMRGARVERKRFAISAHYRQVESSSINTLEQRFDLVLSHHPELRKTTGKKVFELRPNIEWDKGRALLHLLEVLNNDSGRVFPIYIGDDTTDEDAFRAITHRGLAIAVYNETYPTIAHYVLRDPHEVVDFLQEIAEFAERETLQRASG